MEKERGRVFFEQRAVISPVSTEVCVGLDMHLDKVRLWCDMMRAFISKAVDAIPCCT